MWFVCNCCNAIYIIYFWTIFLTEKSCKRKKYIGKLLGRYNCQGIVVFIIIPMASAKWETKSEYIFLVSTKLLPNLTNNKKTSFEKLIESPKYFFTTFWSQNYYLLYSILNLINPVTMCLLFIKALTNTKRRH